MSDNNFNQNQAPAPAPYGGMPPQQEMTVKDWVITCILISIPCVNIIMLLIWAFSNDNGTKSNFAKGYLISFVIVFIVSTIILLVSYGALISWAASLYGSGFYY